jgi:hypothetical protein
MGYDKDKLDEAVLALLHLNVWEEDGSGARAWKGVPWEATDRLYQKGLIGDPKSKAKSVVLTGEGRVRPRKPSGSYSPRDGEKTIARRSDYDRDGPCDPIDTWRPLASGHYNRAKPALLEGQPEAKRALTGVVGERPGRLRKRPFTV